jgi:lipoprotein-releasing system ATP-binding protein
MTPLISAKEITKTFLRPSKVELLKGISLDLLPERSMAIMGASGEGKTTLLHILGTIEQADQGSLSICGKPLKRMQAPLIRHKHIGFIFQAFSLLEDFTALENILMPARIGRKSVSKKSPAYQQAEELLEIVDMKARAHFPAKLLSGGEKQRVAIARALFNDPEILLADEPSGNLDHENSTIIHSILMELVKKMKKGLIVVTHDQELAHLCDEIFLLKDGLLSPIK